jgi:hypothetical protein
MSVLLDERRKYVMTPVVVGGFAAKGALRPGDWGRSEEGKAASRSGYIAFGLTIGADHKSETFQSGLGQTHRHTTGLKSDKDVGERHRRHQSTPMTFAVDDLPAVMQRRS